MKLLFRAIFLISTLAVYSVLASPGILDHKHTCKRVSETCGGKDGTCCKPDLKCKSGICCIPNLYGPCSTGGGCCAGLTCTTGNKKICLSADGQPCKYSKTCHSGNCANGTCKANCVATLRGQCGDAAGGSACCSGMTCSVDDGNICLLNEGQPCSGGSDCYNYNCNSLSGTSQGVCAGCIPLQSAPCGPGTNRCCDPLICIGWAPKTPGGCG